MKKIILITTGLTLLILVSVFSGIFNENFGLIRGLRAKHLLATNPKMIEGLQPYRAPVNQQISEIEMTYNQEITNYMNLRDQARNDYFKVPQDSQEARNFQYIYLDAVYNIVILEQQKTMEVAAINVERYKGAKEVRLSTF